MKEYIYQPVGVCSSKFLFKITDEGIIKELTVTDGCSGNLQGIAALVVDRNIDEVIIKLQDIKCGTKDTSCPMQIAKALKEYKNYESD